MPHRLDGTALAAAVGPLPATPVAAAMRAALLDLDADLRLGLGTSAGSVIVA
ncbi:MAG: hypothetical protein KGL18_02985 [Burkholderiales bacterium]|nr:hypothetical protein [Burkholderiales bacterium]MDE2501931.1 hypothetical protein [Burkholderiales bacterium]